MPRASFIMTTSNPSPPIEDTYLGRRFLAADRPASADQVDQVVAQMNFGTATAVKRGRRSEWPYVPVIDYGTHTTQQRGLAYATRFEAVERALKAIVAAQESMRRKLRDPRYRALREQHGLPRDISSKVEG